ncbi:MAG: hypothetical protein ACLPSO_14945, partial [Terracidiphilus sp.]
MTDFDPKPLTPKEGCEECNHLHERVDFARRAKFYLTNGLGTGYRREKSRSRQYKQVREQMNRDENAERLARAELRMHEMVAHEGIT